MFRSPPAGGERANAKDCLIIYINKIIFTPQNHPDKNAQKNFHQVGGMVSWMSVIVSLKKQLRQKLSHKTIVSKHKSMQ